MPNKGELINRILSQGTEEVIDEAHLRSALSSGGKLRIKHGIDPTSPSIHIGHTVPLQKIRALQELGHTAVIIIGDYTATIGDPSEKDKTRPLLSKKEVKQNAKEYKKQILKVLKKGQTEFHMQSEWYKSFKLTDILELLARVSTSQLLSHETFRKRLDNEQAFMVHELIYPVLQGYDSVMVKADVEIGAMEQKFNLLMGRTIQKQHGMKQQDVIMVPYLIGTDGKEKMSKSSGNTINLTDSPEDMYGKLMSIPDTLIVPYAELLTGMSAQALKDIKVKSESDPRAAKAELARIITAMFWDEKKAEKAAEEFSRVFRSGELPSDIPVKRVVPTTVESAGLKIAATSINPMDLLVQVGLAGSKNEARRLIEQGGVTLDGHRVSSREDTVIIKNNSIVRVGKRSFVKIKL